MLLLPAKAGQATLHLWQASIGRRIDVSRSATAALNCCFMLCAGDEVVGCYTGDVQRSSDVPASIKEVSAQREATGTFANRPVSCLSFVNM